MASSIQKVSVQVAIDKQAWEDSLEGLSGPQLKKQVAKVKRELSAATRTVGFDRGGLSESQQRGAEKNLQRLKDSDLLTKNEEKRFALAIKIGEAERRIAELRKSSTGSAASGSALAETEKKLQSLQDAFVGGGTDIDFGGFDSAANKMQEIVESEKEAVKVANKLADEMEQAFATERKDAARLAKDRDDAAKKQQRSVDSLAKQRERSLYKNFTDEQRLTAQAARKRQAAADSLAKQRERALYKEFQQREREEKKAADRAARLAARGTGGAGGENEKGFQDAGRRNQAAATQLIYAFEDAASSTDGLRGALRGASNNISQFAQIFFQGSPLALGLATFGTVAAQLALTVWNMYDATEEAVEVEDELAKAREKTADISEKLLSRLRDANSEFSSLFGSRGRTAATGALGEKGQRARQIVAEDLGIRDLQTAAAAGDRGAAELKAEEDALRGRVRDIQRFIELGEVDTDASNQELRDRVAKRDKLGETLGFESGIYGYDMKAVRAALRETQEAGREVEGQRIAAEGEAGATRRRARTATEEQGRVNEIADRFGELGKAFKEAGEESDSLTAATLLYDEALAALESGSLDKFREKLTQVERELDFASDGVEGAQERAQAKRDQKLFDDLTGVTASAEQEDKVNSFLRAFFAGNDDASAASAAAAAAKAFGIDASTQRPLDSKAAIGVANLRSGGELTRLLSGDDGSRGIVEVGKEQVELLKTIAKLAEEQALGLAD